MPKRGGKEKNSYRNHCAISSPQDSRVKQSLAFYQLQRNRDTKENSKKKNYKKKRSCNYIC